MKNLKFNILAIICLMSVSAFNAQNYRGGILSNQPSVPSFLEDSQPELVEGSMYLSEEYSPIKILGLDEDLRYLAKYNAFTGHMEVKGMDGGLEAERFIIPKDSKNIAVEFIANGIVFQTYDYVDNDEIKRDFFEKLSSNHRVALMKKHIIKYNEKVKAPTTFDLDKPAEFKKLNDVYYLKIGSDNLVVVPSNLKRIAEIFPKKYGASIKTFIENNELKKSNEEDLITLVNYISLL